MPWVFFVDFELTQVSKAGKDGFERNRSRRELGGASRSLEIGKETTHGIVRWTRVASTA